VKKAFFCLLPPAINLATKLHEEDTRKRKKILEKCQMLRRDPLALEKKSRFSSSTIERDSFPSTLLYRNDASRKKHHFSNSTIKRASFPSTFLYKNQTSRKKYQNFTTTIKLE
jgi:hypothetical protein